MSKAADISRLLSEADAARQRGDAAGIVAAMEAILAIDPAHARALNVLAMARQREGDLPGAIALFTRATVADPGAPELWLNCAAAERAAGRIHDEIASLDGALAADPYCLPALLARGLAAEKLGAQRLAARSFAAAIGIVGDAANVPSAIAAALAHGRTVIAADKAALAARLDPLRGSDAATARFDHCVDIVTGRRKLYACEPTGLAYPGLPAIEFFARADLPWLPQAEAATPVFQREFAALIEGDAAGFVPYVDYPPGTPVNQWGGLNHSPDWSAFFLWKDGVRQDANCARCPESAAILEGLPMLDLPGRGPAAFFSVLRPGAHIPPHTGVTNIRSIVHLPLFVPPNCRFRVGSQEREWVEGTAFAFDDTIEHEAWNRSDRIRAVLIFDIWNPLLTTAEHDLLRALTAETDAWSTAA